jgi:glycine/D-amino acid oxidase-like deaminating enzyme
MHDQVDIAIVGAGIVGIATAYHLCQQRPQASVVLIDARAPMSLTSAVSGENYRTWWPHPTIAALCARSVELVEEIATTPNSGCQISRRGYAYLTRMPDTASLLRDLQNTYVEDSVGEIRVHDGRSAKSYLPNHVCKHWSQAPDGADVLLSEPLRQQHFPHLARDLTAIVHVRRAGDISAHQFGNFMLDAAKAKGARLLCGRLVGVQPGPRRHLLDVRDSEGRCLKVETGVLVNAAGPFANEVAELTGDRLPLVCVKQQKLAFEDRYGAVPRDSPFAIDVDGQTLTWRADERESLAADPETMWLTRPLPSGIHCRPDGGEYGTWIKLGWAFNQACEAPSCEPSPTETFPEVVVRGAARANPALAKYIGWLPRQHAHYCGYYTKTLENWPIIGPQGTDGTFVVAGLSGYGTMAACAAGELAAAWICGAALPHYAKALSLERYHDPSMMAEATRLGVTGEL